LVFNNYNNNSNENENKDVHNNFKFNISNNSNDVNGCINQDSKYFQTNNLNISNQKIRYINEINNIDQTDESNKLNNKIMGNNSNNKNIQILELNKKNFKNNFNNYTNSYNEQKELYEGDFREIKNDNMNFSSNFDERNQEIKQNKNAKFFNNKDNIKNSLDNNNSKFTVKKTFNENYPIINKPKNLLKKQKPQKDMPFSKNSIITDISIKHNKFPKEQKSINEKIKLDLSKERIRSDDNQSSKKLKFDMNKCNINF